MSEIDWFDVIVIGAGIHGAGVAQAAAAAGYRVLVVERSAPGAGTSSKSSKLIHGGLRYLESGQFRLVREALRERALLLRNAPELVRPLRSLIPVYRQGTRRPGHLRAGLALYTLLGNFGGFRQVDLRRWDNPDGLETRDLQAVFAYSDAQTDDAALTRAVLGSALGLGARFICPADVVEIKHLPRGYVVEYLQHGVRHSRCGATVVNAAGPWVNDVLARVRPALPELRFEWVQGAHLVMPGSLTAGGYYVEAPRDRRAVFVLPHRNGTTLIGTTETPTAAVPAVVDPTPEEMAYLLETYACYFPGRDTHVVEAFAGLRVLPRGAGDVSARSRETLLATDGGDPPRLVSVCGGKLTTYRATAERVLKRLRHALPEPKPKADTRRIWLMPVD